MDGALASSVEGTLSISELLEVGVAIGLDPCSAAPPSMLQALKASSGEARGSITALSSWMFSSFVVATCLDVASVEEASASCLDSMLWRFAVPFATPALSELALLGVELLGFDALLLSLPVGDAMTTFSSLSVAFSCSKPRHPE